MKWDEVSAGCWYLRTSGSLSVQVEAADGGCEWTVWVDTRYNGMREIASAPADDLEAAKLTALTFARDWVARQAAALG